MFLVNLKSNILMILFNFVIFILIYLPYGFRGKSKKNLPYGF